MSSGCLEESQVQSLSGMLDFLRALPSKDQALCKDIERGKVLGLHYQIETVPLVRNGINHTASMISIEGWEYSIANESSEYPVLFLVLCERDEGALSFEDAVAEIRIYDTALPKTRRSAHRALSAASYFIKAIKAGIVPDVAHILQRYHLHPVQVPLHSKSGAVYASDLTADLSDAYCRAVSAH